jgi:Response regulator of the LytR/AlgR family
MRVLIIEDEKLARDLLKSYLKDYEEVFLLGECENGFEGVRMINELQPDVVLLDIQMPKINGFEMLQLLDHKPEIIFTTAYDQFALKAFELNAVDYLLKPFSKERLLSALEKASQRIENKEDPSGKLDRLSEIVPEGHLERVVVKNKNKISVIPVNSICYIESLDDYVFIYTESERHIKQTTMKYFEENLSSKSFVRIHRSYIVNVEFIDEIQQYEKDSYIVILKNKVNLKVSKSGFKNLKSILNF